MAKLEDLTGYDVESKIGATGKLRFIEVKDRAVGAPTVTVTRNEILTSLNPPDDFIVAIAQADDGQQKPDFAVESIKYNLQNLLGRGDAQA
jgi:hypothetical protein